MKQHLYDRHWRAARAVFLSRNQLCCLCAARGVTRMATVVDHRIPHRGDAQLFWDESNWQPLCKVCHDAVKQALEKGGQLRGCDADGLPFDRSHHWQTKRSNAPQRQHSVDPVDARSHDVEAIASPASSATQPSTSDGGIGGPILGLIPLFIACCLLCAFSQVELGGSLGL
jgi:5-methylcytosine-specific restriction protein A